MLRLNGLICVTMLAWLYPYQVLASPKSPRPDARTNAGKSDISITIGRPRHWTLDDAHYLLTGMHNRTRQIQIKPLDMIDSTGENAGRFSSTQTELGIAGKFDQAIAVKNDVMLQNLENDIEDLNTARQREADLTAQLQSQSAGLTQLKIRESQQQSAVNALQVEYNYQSGLVTTKTAQMNSLSDGDPQKIKLKNDVDALSIQIETLLSEKRAAEAELNTTKGEIAVIEAQVSATQTSLAAANDAQSKLATSITSAQASQVNDLNSQLDASEAKKAVSGVTPSYPPSLILDNYVQAENVALAKKLTLLRKDLGEDKTVVFLELPHTIQTQDKISKGLQAQVFWRVSSYCTGDISYELDNITDKIYAYVKEQKTDRERLGLEELSKFIDDEKIGDIIKSLSKEAAARQRNEELLNLDNGDSIYLGRLDRLNLSYGAEQAAKREIKERLGQFLVSKDMLQGIACGSSKIDLPLSQETISSVHPVAWDMIPRADAYNVTDFRLTQNQSLFGAALSFLSGIGLDASYKRKAEMFERFKTQDVFASAFGQGTPEFGWVFNPKPGSKRISSGLKSTYTTLIVPRNASYITLSSTACVLNPKQLPSTDYANAASNGAKCNKEVNFPIQLKDDLSFWVDSLDHLHDKYGGDIQTLLIRGKRFSPFQLEVLIDGHPLAQFDGDRIQYKEVENGQSKSVKPILGDVSRVIPETTTDAPSGYFQVTNSGSVAIHFRMKNGYVGTPEITFVTPSKTLSLNKLYIEINGRQNQQLYKLSDDMDFFKARPREITIENSHVSKIGNIYSIYLTGDGFDKLSGLAINGISGLDGCPNGELSPIQKKPACAWREMSRNIIAVQATELTTWPILIWGQPVQDGETQTAFLNVVKP